MNEEKNENLLIITKRDEVGPYCKNEKSEKSGIACLILLIFFGWYGFHKFYVGRYGAAIFRLGIFVMLSITLPAFLEVFINILFNDEYILNIETIDFYIVILSFSILSIMQIIDLILLTIGKFKDANGKYINLDR